MKKFLSFLLLCIVFTDTYAHKEWVHQYIVQQAYNLLVDYYEFSLPEMAIHMGEYGPGEAGWRTGSILTGAWREDTEDVIGNSGSWSGNHFWEADISDAQMNFIPEIGPQINAYQKVLKFAHGDWNLEYQPPGSQIMYVYQYNSLVDLYENGNLHQVGYFDIPTTQFYSTNIWIVATIELRNLLVWEILGRMCHLLADMSVPAHVHFDQHVCGAPFFDPDDYEVLIGGSTFGQCNTQGSGTNHYLNYSANTAFNSGGFINPYLFDLNNPLRYLFYSTNQIADHFPSNDKDGDNNAYNNPYPDTQENLNAMGPSPNSVDIIQIADKCMDQVIRATAGLLYWFAIECDMMKSVTITTNRTEDFVQVRNPALSIDPNSQYYWQPTPHTLKFDNSITLDLMADPWSEGYAFIGWEKRDRDNFRISTHSELEWLNANTSATSSFIANYAPLVTVSFNPIQIESQNANTYYKNLTTGEVSSSFTFPQGYPITVEAVAPQDYMFLGWSDVNGFIGGYNPASFNPTTNVSGYYATFKKMNASGDPNAYENNNQRKFVRNYSGVLFSVYSSMEKVWIEYSTNNGSTWELGNEKRPLFEGLDAKNPSIEIWNYDVGKTYLLVIAQVNIDGEADIRISRLTWDPSHYTFREWNHIPFDEQSVFWPFPYSETNLKPVIGMISPGRILIAVDMLELGKTIWFQAGELSYNSYINWFQDYWITSQNTLSNVSMYSTKLDIDASQGDEYVCWIAYEEVVGSTSPRIMVTKAYMTSYGGFDLTTPIILSENNGFIKNYKPSVTAWLEGEDNHCAAVIWTAFRKTALPDEPSEDPGGGNGPGNPQSLGETKVFFRSFSNGSWSQFRSYGNNINSAHLNKNTNNTYAFAWSEGTNNINRYVKSNNLTTLYSTNTVGKYLQVGNFANLNAMRLNSFKTSTSPYLFQLSNTFGNIYEEEFNTDRSSVIVKDTTAFYFSIGNVKVNDELVDFIEVPDSTIIKNKETLNAYLLSGPFNLSDESNFIYSIKFGVTDSASAANTLIDNKLVHFQVCLIDDQTGEVLGTLDDVIFDAQNITPYENITYQVNTQGIGNRTCRLKLVTDDNISFNYALIDNCDNDTTLAKRGLIEKSFNGGEKVETYELVQNYPNPFNPTTTIKYQIPKTSIVTLKVYDILGAEVATLVNEEKIPGKYEVSFDATRLASGVYIYRLIAERFISSKKMILLK